MNSEKTFAMPRKMDLIQLICLTLVTLACLLAPGCGGYSADSHRVQASSAREILEQVLTSWQQGEPIDNWQQQKPQVVVQDMDWKNGARLESFEIQGDGEALDANLHCQVKLKLLLPGKDTKEKTVTYLVGTSPVATVFRAMSN